MSAADSLHNVRTIQPINVLVASRDTRFLKLARFLLERHGRSVEATRKLHELLDVVDRTEPNVVVLDATDWLAPAARRIAALNALYPRTTVVAVSDDPESDTLAGVTLIDKWGPADRLSREVELAYVFGATTPRAT